MKELVGKNPRDLMKLVNGSYREHDLVNASFVCNGAQLSLSVPQLYALVFLEGDSGFNQCEKLEKCFGELAKLVVQESGRLIELGLVEIKGEIPRYFLTKRARAGEYKVVVYKK